MFFMYSVHTYGICKSWCLCEKKCRIIEAVEQRLGSTGHDKAAIMRSRETLKTNGINLSQKILKGNKYE